jgi:hypothetical protein
VFVRDLRAGTTLLRSTHRPRKRADARQGLMAARMRAWSRRLDSPLALAAVALGGAGAGIVAMRRRRQRWDA